MKVAHAYWYRLPAHTHEIVCRDYRPDRGDCFPMIPPPEVRAHYECQQCDAQWTGMVGPADCPQCGCPYVLWLNRYAGRPVGPGGANGAGGDGLGAKRLMPGAQIQPIAPEDRKFTLEEPPPVNL